MSHIGPEYGLLSPYMVLENPYLNSQVLDFEF